MNDFIDFMLVNGVDRDRCCWNSLLNYLLSAPVRGWCAVWSCQTDSVWPQVATIGERPSIRSEFYTDKTRYSSLRGPRAPQMAMLWQWYWQISLAGDMSLALIFAVGSVPYRRGGRLGPHWQVGGEGRLVSYYTMSCHFFSFFTIKYPSSFFVG